MTDLVPIERIETKILLIRGQKVMMDRDLAELYGVPTKRLNEQVKRNIYRFPPDFMFRLSGQEKNELVANCDRFKPLKHSSSLPLAFTEQGVAMLSSILNSKIAIIVNIQIMRAFTKLRQILSTHKALREKIEEMEKKYDSQFKVVFDVIKKMLERKEQKPKKIGFVKEG